MMVSCRINNSGRLSAIESSLTHCRCGGKDEARADRRVTGMAARSFRTLIVTVGLAAALGVKNGPLSAVQPLRIGGGGPIWSAGPDVLNRRNADGPLWVAASEVLDSNGSYRSTWGLSEDIRLQVEKQSEAFALVHPEGLAEDMEDGVRPARQLCAGVPPLDPDGPRYVYALREDTRQDDFDLAALTAPVAVAATVADFIPGFLSTGDPGLLLVLEEVVPLHRRSLGAALCPDSDGPSGDPRKGLLCRQVETGVSLSTAGSG